MGEDGQPVTEEVTVTIPRFKVSTVFDLAQTEGDPLPELGVNELTASVENFDAFMEGIRSVSPVPLRFDEIKSGAKGYFDNIAKEIVIQGGMSESQIMKTAIHEAAHAMLHDRDIMQEQGIQKDQQTREVEAESIAYTVCQHFGLDTAEYSFPYIAGWSSNKEAKELKSSLDTIRKTSSALIVGIENSVHEHLRAQETDKEMPYIHHFYVIDDLSAKGSFKLNKEYEKYIEALNITGIVPVTVREIYEFTLDGVSYAIDPPRKSEYNEDKSNNSSLIVSVTNGDDSFLLTGDAQTERLAEFLDTNRKAYDVLKVPHHGKDEPLLEPLLESVKPSYAVITSSEVEPESEEVLKVLEQAGIRLLLTREGAITLHSDGTAIRFVDLS